MMMINNNERVSTMTMTDKVGHGFYGTRKDGRKFAGKIVNVRSLPKGTLVVVQDGEAHKSFYVEDMLDYSTTLVDGQAFYTFTH